MEKSIEFGLEHYIHSIPGVQEIDPHMCSPLVLAYIGDCVFDLIIKDHGRRKRKQACTTDCMKRQVITSRLPHSHL